MDHETRIPLDGLSEADRAMMSVPDENGGIDIVDEQTVEVPATPEQEVSAEVIDKLKTNLHDIAQSAQRFLHELQQRDQERFTGLLFEEDQDNLRSWIGELARISELAVPKEQDISRAIVGLSGTLEKTGTIRRNGALRDDPESLHRLRRGLQGLHEAVHRFGQLATVSGDKYSSLLSSSVSTERVIEEKWNYLGRMADALERL